LLPLRQWLAQLQSAQAVTHLELLDVAGHSGVIVRHTKKLSVADREALAALAGASGCEIWLQGDKGASLTALDSQACDPRLHYELPDFSLDLAFHPQDFIQVNPAVNRRMVQQAIDLLQLTGTERVLDLFCGIGNFTLPLARACAEVIGVEAVEAMVERGRENAARSGLENLRFMAADLTKLSVNQLQQRCGKVDAILLDPPRIVYVSCNPATLARDAKLLADSGYRLESLGVLDMFPHTTHVESMALFVRP
jgi:23S rRNA (uracil1939-C5)-methyltransferase